MSPARKFAQVAAGNPDAPALAIRDKVYAYGDLDREARRWAAHISGSLGRAPAIIGVFGSRSFTSYTGILASLYCGATFVPLNPRFPVERTRRMIDRAGLDFLIADALGTQQLPEILAGLSRPVPVLAPEDPGAEKATAELDEIPDTGSDSIAYLLFTSGSTGQPKGVPITHGNLRAYLDWGHRRYNFVASDRFSQTFDQTFDLSIHDQFLCWESGACLHVLSPPELLAPARFIRERELTVWFSVPSVVAQMRRRNTLSAGSFPSLRWSLFCGEPLPEAAAREWQRAAPNSVVENLYGPTELTIACLVHRWDDVASPDLCRDGIVPLGAPFPGLTPIVVNDAGQPALSGDTGELCISGPQTFRGYWQDDERSAAAFIDRAEGRFYRTGDRVARLPTGEFAYLGRVDHQVKVLGFRVELGEIESVLRQTPGVLAAVALGWPVVDGSAQGIVVFVQGANADIKDALARARTQLSAYMVPSAIHMVEEMPLNANGKIDRAALQSTLLSTVP